MTAQAHPGIDVTGDLTGGVIVTIYGRERIRAVCQIARLALEPDDVDLVALRRAVGEDHGHVVLPVLDDEEDADFLAGILDEVRNGDDPALGKAAAALRTMKRLEPSPSPVDWSS